MNLNLGKPALASMTVWGGILLVLGESLCQTGIADAIAAALREGANGAGFCSAMKTAGLVGGIFGLRRAMPAPPPTK